MRLTFLAILLTSGCLLANAPYQEPFKLPENPSPTPKSLMLDQIDNTDTYAIPYDTSEVEDEIQIDDLYQKQDRLQKRAAEKQNTQKNKL